MAHAHGNELRRLDELGRLDSPIHRIDARVQTLTTAVFLVCVLSFPRHALSALMPFFLYPATLAACGRIPLALLLRKLLWAAPFALAVALANPFLDTRTLLRLGPVPISGGWLSFLSILARFVLSVSAALLLVSCTGMHRLCRGLERLGLPRLLAAQFLLLYRYLFTVTDEAGRLVYALRLRAPGHRALRLRVYGALVGHLLLRALARAERIHRAMLARGFTGVFRAPRPERLRPADLLFATAWLLFFAAARRWNLADLLGATLLRTLT